MANLPIKNNPTLNLQMELLQHQLLHMQTGLTNAISSYLKMTSTAVDAKIYEDDKNGAKIRLGMENGHLYYVQLPSEEADGTGE